MSGWKGVSICRRELWPWWETSNEAVVVCTLDAHPLDLKKENGQRVRSSPLAKTLHCLKFSFHPRSSSSLSGPVRPSRPSLCPRLAPRSLKDEGMSFISLKEKAPPQTLCRRHLVHRWDASNQSSQLPLKSHHFPLITHWFVFDLLESSPEWLYPDSPELSAV